MRMKERERGGGGRKREKKKGLSAPPEMLTIPSSSIRRKTPIRRGTKRPAVYSSREKRGRALFKLKSRGESL